MKIYTIYGKPVPLKRPRVTKFVTYDEQRDQKQADRTFLREQRGARLAIANGPLEIKLSFFMPIPKSTTKKNPVNGKPHHKRPDLDNLIKYALDVMQPVLIDDDSFISNIIADKLYDKEPRTEIIITRL